MELKKQHNTYELAMEDDFGGAKEYGTLYASDKQLGKYIEAGREEFYDEWFAYIADNGDDWF